MLLKKTRALILSAGLAAAALTLTVPASAAPVSTASVCGLHYEAGAPTQLWWHNCDASPDLVELHYAVLPNQKVCIPPYADQWVASQDYDNPLGWVNSLSLAGEWC
ncbi:hypothetical protein ACIRG5_09070 [Lentzea sp. NPDC102401]|uniref:hypothetical protein n=1 Tax=Lentzea sp. NPDC102401 TaxID=3364128 RepID=UPI00381D329D